MTVNEIQLNKLLQLNVKVKMIMEILNEISGNISFFRGSILPEFHKAILKSNYKINLKEFQELFDLVDIDVSERCDDLYKLSTNIQKSFDNLRCFCYVVRQDNYKLADDED
jgi:hypothetical protein